jgi:thiol-disulfide isomerase/thioredoxin
MNKPGVKLMIAAAVLFLIVIVLVNVGGDEEVVNPQNDSVGANQQAEVDSNEPNSEPENNRGDLENAPVEALANSAGTYEEYSPEKLERANDGDVVIFFHAAWCSSCKALEANINSSLGEIPEGVTILKADFDEDVELKEKYGVKIQHSFVQVDANGEAIAKWVGGNTLGDITKNLK